MMYDAHSDSSLAAKEKRQTWKDYTEGEETGASDRFGVLQ